jgi:phosphate starvation-inducible PhoH-like protein
MKMLLTRIGEGSKMIVLGDTAQHERGFEDNGLKDLIERLGDSAGDISHIQFNEADVVRNEVIKNILRLYG